MSGQPHGIDLWGCPTDVPGSPVKQLRVIASAIAITSALALSACSAPPPVVTPTATPSPSVSMDPFGPQPEYFPEGTAVENKPLFDWVLNHAVLTDSKDAGKKMAKALVRYGFKKKRIELTKSKSGTGKPADQIVISVRIGKSCLIGQRMKDKTYASTIESALKSGGCLVGDTREITW